MAKSFESLRIWHDARRLAARIYVVTRSGSFRSDFGLRDQMRRAAVSIMSNIAEGFERGRPREFVHYLSLAKGSAGEVRAQLYIAQDVGHLDSKIAGELRQSTAVLSRQIATLARRIQSRMT